MSYYFIDEKYNIFNFTNVTNITENSSGQQYIKNPTDESSKLTTDKKYTFTVINKDTTIETKNLTFIKLPFTDDNTNYNYTFDEVVSIDIYDNFKKIKYQLPNQVLAVDKTLFLYNKGIYKLNNQKFEYFYKKLDGYPMISGSYKEPSLTAPPTTDTNDEYVVNTLLRDPELSKLFTLANYNVEWNKATLIKTIEEILGNETDKTNPLTRQTITPKPLKKPGPITNPNIKFLSDRDNKFTFKDLNNRNYTFVNKTGDAGYIGMKLDTNNNIIEGSYINFQYNIPKTDFLETDNGYEISTNSGTPKCRFKRVCNEVHYYHPDCTTVIDSNNTCHCECSSEIVFNDNKQPHTHCISDTSSELVNHITKIQSIKIDGKVSNYNKPTSPPYLTYDPDISYLCQLIADYYILLIQKKVNSNLLVNNNVVQINNQSHEDSNELYREQYMKIINISVGIISTGFIIHYILKK